MFRYAFITHQTRRDAEWNIRKAIDHSILGPDCCVEYTKGTSTFHNDHQNLQKRKLAIQKIPMDVNEHELRVLLNNPHILNYCPARKVSCSTKDTNTNNPYKILLG